MTQDPTIIIPSLSLIAIAFIAFIVWHSRVLERRAELASQGEREAAAKLAFPRALWRHHGLKVKTTAVQVVGQDNFIHCFVEVPKEHPGKLGGTTIRGRYFGTGQSGHVEIIDETVPEAYVEYFFDRISPHTAQLTFSAALSKLGIVADPSLITTSTETEQGMECTFRFQDGEDVQAHGYCSGSERQGMAHVISCTGYSGDLIARAVNFRYIISSDGSVVISPSP